jgi:hypothetical protein
MTSRKKEVNDMLVIVLLKGLIQSKSKRLAEFSMRLST